MELLINIFLLLLIFVAATIVVAAEFALVRVRLNKLKSEQQTSTVKHAQHMVNNINEYLSTIQVGVTITSMLAGWLGEPVMTDIFLTLGIGNIIPQPFLSIIAFLFLTYVEIVLTELLPKNLAMGAPVKTLLFVTKPVHYLHVIAYPLVWLLNVSTIALAKVLKIPDVDANEDTYTQSELINITFASSKDSSSEITEGDAKLVSRVVQLDDTSIDNIMTPVDKVATKSTVINSKRVYTRVPSDDFKYYYHQGVRYDLPKMNVKTNLSEAIDEMARTKTPIAAVVDNDNKALGIITNTDIYEQLFGPLKDEKDIVLEK